MCVCVCARARVFVCDLGGVDGAYGCLRMVRDGDVVDVIYASSTVKEAKWLELYETELAKHPGVSRRSTRKFLLLE